MKILNKEESKRHEFTREIAQKEEGLISRNYLSLLYMRFLSYANSQKNYMSKSSKCKFLIGKDAESKFVNIDGENILKHTFEIYLGKIYPTKVDIYNNHYQLVDNSQLAYILNPYHYEVDTNSRLIDDDTQKQRTSEYLKKAYSDNFSEPQIYMNDFYLKWNYQLIDCDEPWFFSFNPEAANEYIDELIYLSTGSRSKNVRAQSTLIKESNKDKAKKLLSTLSKEDKEALLKSLSES